MSETGAPAGDGSRTAADGTPMAVDVSRDRRTRVGWVFLLGGPVTWFAHFLVVYLVAEAGCTGGGPGLRAFNPPIPAVVTLAATVVASGACIGFAVWAHRRWRRTERVDATDIAGGGLERTEEHDHGGALALASLLLAVFSSVAVLFVGLPALVLEC